MVFSTSQVYMRVIMVFSTSQVLHQVVMAFSYVTGCHGI